jgi:hypothetical protein
MLSAKIIVNAKLVDKGAPYDMRITLKDKVDEELLAVIKA